MKIFQGLGGLLAKPGTMGEPWEKSTLGPCRPTPGQGMVSWDDVHDGPGECHTSVICTRTYRPAIGRPRLGYSIPPRGMTHTLLVVGPSTTGRSPTTAGRRPISGATSARRSAAPTASCSPMGT